MYQPASSTSVSFSGETFQNLTSLSTLGHRPSGQSSVLDPVWRSLLQLVPFVAAG